MLPESEAPDPLRVERGQACSVAVKPIAVLPSTVRENVKYS